MRTNRPSGKKLFEEEQQFKQSWLWWLVGSILLLVIGTNIFAFIVSRQQSTPMSRLGMLIGIVGTLIPLVILYMARLDTVITDEGIYFRWRPFRKSYRVIRFPELRRMTVNERSPMRLGSHYVPGYGWVHQVGGRNGVELEMAGSRLWLGTQRLDAFLHALEKAGGNKAQIVEMKQKSSL
jgi:hypothetical protein